MRKHNKTIGICSVCIAAIAVLSLCLLDHVTPETYSSAKEKCEEILGENQIHMEELAVNSMRSSENISGDFLSYSYCCYRDEGYVKFDIDAQGMLGGQYWELVYTEDGSFYGQSETYLYEEVGGNNIVKAERLNEHWWFLWSDYDGTDRSDR